MNYHEIIFGHSWLLMGIYVNKGYMDYRRRRGGMKNGGKK